MKKYLWWPLFFLAMLVAPLAQVAAQTPTPGGYAVLGGTVGIAASNSSSRVALPANAIPYGAVTIYNRTIVDAFVLLGDVTVAATTSSIPVRAGTSFTIWVNSNTYLAAITAGGSASLDIYQATGPIQLGFHSVSPAVPHISNGATRQYMNNGSSGALQNAMSRGMFFWRNETTTGPVVQVSPCRISSTGGETCFAATTFKISIYDYTALTSTLCGTSAAVAVPTTVACPGVTLVQGHQYAVCQYVSSPNGINLYQSMLINGLSTLDGVAFGTTGSPATDNTASCGSVPDGSGNHNQSIFALGVLSATLQPGVCTIGDSRDVGNAAVFDSSADLGDFHPSIGQKFGYIQLGAAGIFLNPTNGYLNSHATRDTVINAGCTTVIDSLGVNDMTSNASSAATVAGWHTTLAALYPTKYIIGSTIMTETTSSDSWATNFYSGANNQTCAGNACTIPKSFNTLTRAGISGESTYYDTMRTFDPGLTGFWCINWLPGSATGLANFCTAEGVHPSANAMILEKSSGWINLSYIQ